MQVLDSQCSFGMGKVLFSGRDTQSSGGDIVAEEGKFSSLIAGIDDGEGDFPFYFLSVGSFAGSCYWRCVGDFWYS